MLKCFALVCILGLTVSAFEWDSAAQTGKKSQRMNLLSRTVGARMLAGTNGQMDSTFQTMNPATGTNQQFVPIARQSNAAINSMTQTPTQTGGQVMDNSLTGGQQLTPDQLQQLQQFLSAQTQSQQQTGVQRQMTTQQTATPQQQPTQTFRMDTTGMTGSTGMTGTTMDGVSADQQQRMTGGQFGGQIPTTGGRMMPSTTPVTPMVVSTPMTVMNQASKPSALEQQLLDQQILTQKLKEQLQQLQQQQQQGRTFQQQQPVDTTGFGQTQTPQQQTGRFQQTTDQTTGFGQTQTQTPQQTGRFQQTTDQTTGFGQTQTQTPQQTGRFQQTTDQTTGFGQTQTPTTLTPDQQVQRMTAQQQQKQQQQLLDQINQLNQMNQARTVATPVGSPVVGMQQPTKMTPPTQTFMPTTNTSRMVTSQGMRPPTTGPMMTTTTGGFAGKSTARMGGDICASAKPGELLPHPLDETQFLVCNELGEITLMDCPNHTVFNPHLKLCDLTTDMPILCKSNPCLNGAKCVDVSPIEFRCECPQGFSGKTCEKFDTCSTSRPCGNDGVCLSFALGSPIPHVCLCNGGRSVGLMCDKGEQNPCTMPGSSTKLMPVNFNRAVFAHCEGARPHFKFCQPPLMFSASKQACEWSV